MQITNDKVSLLAFSAIYFSPLLRFLTVAIMIIYVIVRFPPPNNVTKTLLAQVSKKYRGFFIKLVFFYKLFLKSVYMNASLGRVIRIEYRTISCAAVCTH